MSLEEHTNKIRNQFFGAIRMDTLYKTKRAFLGYVENDITDQLEFLDSAGLRSKISQYQDALDGLELSKSDYIDHLLTGRRNKNQS